MRTVIIIGLACVIGMLAADVQAQERRSEFDEKYGVISERNMFLRERSRPRPPSTRPSSYERPERPPEPPESKFVLRGVAIEEHGFRAYLESSTGMTRVAPGDEIARGHIAEIAIDAIAYVHEEQVTWVFIGQNLAGNKPSAPVATSSSPSTSSDGSSGSTSAGPSNGGTPADMANLSAEERMRLRNRGRNR